MTATYADRPRLQLEDAIAALLDADEHARCAYLRLRARARTLDEKEIIEEIGLVREALSRAHHHIVAYHPQRLEGQ
jgi:hypothetical protein